MERSVVEMIVNRAKSFGSQEVFGYKGTDGKYTHMSWSNFWEMTQQAACSLIALGFGKNSNIGILSENMPRWIVADIAIQSTQGVVVPFFGNASLEQIKFIIDQTNMRLLFVGNQEQLENGVWALQHTDSLERVVALTPQLNLKDSRCMHWNEFVEIGKSKENIDKLQKSICDIKIEDPATIIYTSGTTGSPKGVILNHKNFIKCFEIHDLRLEVSSDDVSLSFLPISHIFERSWAYYMLHKGAKYVFIDNPKEVINEMQAIKPTLMCAVPRFFEKTYEAFHQEVNRWSKLKQRVFNLAVCVGERTLKYRSKNKSLPTALRLKHSLFEILIYRKVRNIFGGNIRFIPCSGAAMVTNHLRFFHAMGLFVNYGYGATETTATVSCFKKEDFDLNTCGSIMPGVHVKISDSGEILVKGDTVFNGYYNNSEATSKVLKDGWYSTGDKGHLSPEGNLVMTDRINDIFKTSVGKFVSPQRVELNLQNDVFIDQIVVLGDNKKYLTALLVPSYDKLRSVWNAEGVKEYNNEQLAKHPRVVNFMKSRIDAGQKHLPDYERIKHFRLLAEPFSISNNTLTNTHKVRRKLVEANYKDLIDEMYG